MKRVSLLCAVAVAALSVSSARASEFSISFDGGPLGYSGTGIFTASSSGDLYTINGVLSGSVSDPNFGTSAITSLSSYAGADQFLAFPSTTFFDGSGLSFNLANGVSINLFSLDSTDAALESSANGDIPELVSDSVAMTPEPSSLVLLGTAAVLGVADLRRRRQSVA